MNFEEELKKKTGEVKKILAAYLPAPEGFQSRVLEAMEYAVSAGGVYRVFSDLLPHTRRSACVG